MNPELYTRAQRALAELKGAVFELIANSPKGISNAEIGRQLGIYGGHSGQAGHISRTRVGPLLGALGWYLHTGDKEEAMKFFPAPGEELPEKPVQEIIALHKLAATFPCSFAKVQRMARVVIEEQFVSFIC